MATWTKKDDISGEVFQHHVISDGVDIFYLRQTSGDVYHYDISEETDTRILTGSDYGVIDGIAWFSDDLFFICHDANNSYVYRWDNPGTTLVATLTDAAAQPHIWADREACVTYGRQGVGSYIPVVRYTTNGTIWGVGNMPGAANHQGSSPTNYSRDYRALGIFDEFCLHYDGSCLNTCVMNFVAGFWGAKKTDDSEGLTVTGPDVHFATMNRFTKDFVTYTDVTKTVNTTCTSFNLAKSLAVNQTGGGDSEICQFNTDDWTVLDTIDSTLVSDVSFVCMNDGSVYFIGSIGGSWELWERDEVLDPLSAIPARFYHGWYNLVEKFSLPFSGVAPQGMALAQSLGTVVVGSDQPDETMAIYSQHPYSDDVVADDGLPTGTSVSAIRWI